MAWNEPGGNSNDQDPWGNKKKGNKQGPPDLDDIFRKIQNSLNSLLGGQNTTKKSNNDSGSNSQSIAGILLVGFLVVLGVWLYNSIYVVDEQEQAVILRFGKYYETVGPGLNFYFPPIDKKFQENVTRERSYSKEGQMLTEDENIIEVPLTVQYKISDLKSFVLNVDQPEVSLHHATDSAVRHVVGSTEMDQVLTEGRERMASEVEERLQKFLDLYGTGITITQVNLQSAAAPNEVQEAFDDVIRAREDEQREKNKAETYANGVIPEARGQAQRIVEEARGYKNEIVARANGEAARFNDLLAEYEKSPDVTRQRLYIDTMQNVMSKTGKVMVASGDKQNSMLYLPLDKMMKSKKISAASEPKLTLSTDKYKVNSRQETTDAIQSNDAVRVREGR
ncbi:UNVERIFIED_CONTAM: hypothetical protein GTU68_036765 [Idotea baltica]|nr:hypothetical protein [Idotea baltica]